MRFIHLSGGGQGDNFLNAARIAKARLTPAAKPGGRGYWEFHAANGEHLGCASYTDFDPGAMGAMIPATDGWAVIEHSEGYKADAPLTEKYFLTPIIAWVVDPDNGVRPLTYELLAREFAILRPDARVAVPDDCLYESIERWIEHCEKKE